MSLFGILSSSPGAGEWTVFVRFQIGCWAWCRPPVLASDVWRDEYRLLLASRSFTASNGDVEYIDGTVGVAALLELEGLTLST
jgi:hypothetical protein